MVIIIISSSSISTITIITIVITFIVSIIIIIIVQVASHGTMGKAPRKESSLRRTPRPLWHDISDKVIIIHPLYSVRLT